MFKKSRLIFTIVLLRQNILSLALSVTTATFVASRFSSAASFMKHSASIAETTTAIRSWDSEIAISVPSKPSYFLGTASKSMSRPSANSPIATETPPAPKSLHFLIIAATDVFLKSLWIFLSSTGLPFWTSAPHESSDSSVCGFEEPVAPPQPSRPVLPPSSITTSPATGFARLT